MAGTVLEVEGVDVAFGDRRVLDSVSFDIAAGQFAALIGSNGAGKTTLMRVVLGLLQPDRGQVFVDGPASGIGYVPQKVNLDPDMPLRARDLVQLGLDGHRLGFGWRRSGAAEAVDEALSWVGAEGFGGARIGRLSGGEQQRVMIAHALVSRPRLLILDEPLANLDISATNEIVAVLGRVCRQQGVAVLISAHDMNPLIPVMDRVVYMADGRVASGTVDEVVSSDVLSKLYQHPVEVIRAAGRILVVGGTE